jgi:hypothetical protein
MTGVTCRSLDERPTRPAIIETFGLNKIVGSLSGAHLPSARLVRRAAEGYLWVNCPTSWTRVLLT